MKRNGDTDSRWSEFWAQLRRDCAFLWPQIRADLQQMHEDWLEIIALG